MDDMHFHRVQRSRKERNAYLKLALCLEGSARTASDISSFARLPAPPSDNVVTFFDISPFFPLFSLSLSHPILERSNVPSKYAREPLANVWNRLDKSKLFHPAADFYGATYQRARRPSPRAIERNPFALVAPLVATSQEYHVIKRSLLAWPADRNLSKLFVRASREANGRKNSASGDAVVRGRSNWLFRSDYRLSRVSFVEENSTGSRHGDRLRISDNSNLELGTCRAENGAEAVGMADAWHRNFVSCLPLGAPSLAVRD